MRSIQLQDTWEYLICARSSLRTVSELRQAPFSKFTIRLPMVMAEELSPSTCCSISHHCIDVVRTCAAAHRQAFV